MVYGSEWQQGRQRVGTGHSDACILVPPCRLYVSLLLEILILYLLLQLLSLFENQEMVQQGIYSSLSVVLA